MTKRSLLPWLLCLGSLAGCMTGEPGEDVGPDSASPRLAALDDTQVEPVEPNLEEDYMYPNAEQFHALGLELKRGDGHLLLVDCAAEHTLKVETSGPSIPPTPPTYDFCFRVTGPAAQLSLKLPAVYLIGTSNHDVEATVVRAGKTSVLKLEQDFTPTVDAQGNQATLTELRLQ